MLTTALLVATVLVARNRWRAALWLGLGGVVAMVITRSVVHRVIEEAPEIAASRAGGPPSRPSSTVRRRACSVSLR